MKLPTLINASIVLVSALSMASYVLTQFTSFFVLAMGLVMIAMARQGKQLKMRLSGN